MNNNRTQRMQFSWKFYEAICLGIVAMRWSNDGAKNGDRVRNVLDKVKTSGLFIIIRWPIEDDRSGMLRNL